MQLSALSTRKCLAFAWLIALVYHSSSFEVGALLPGFKRNFHSMLLNSIIHGALDGMTHMFKRMHKVQ
jgi:hypothetical protein